MSMFKIMLKIILIQIFYMIASWFVLHYKSPPIAEWFLNVNSYGLLITFPLLLISTLIFKK